MVAKKQQRAIAEMPKKIAPMLCTLTRAPVDNDAYVYEVKWDGYRIIGYADDRGVRLASRSGLDYTKKYPLVAEALEKLGHEVIIDGEVIVENEAGKPDFDALQKYNGKRTPIRYCVFDLLWLDGNDLREQPLTARKELLEMLVKKDDRFLYSKSLADGKALYQQMVNDNMEGVIAKRKDSKYVEGERGDSWLKIPTRKRQEFVIGGWAESDRSRAFKSLLFGAYEDGKLKWIGRSGGGYKEKEMPEILKQLKAIERDTSPFANKVLDTKGAVVHWVEPKLVANFEFATWTQSGRIRKPATFLGFRKDKDPKEVVREVPEDERQPLDEIKTATKPRRKQNKNCST